jgi:hypothetical protein
MLKMCCLFVIFAQNDLKMIKKLIQYINKLITQKREKKLKEKEELMLFESYLNKLQQDADNCTNTGDNA